MSKQDAYSRTDVRNVDCSNRISIAKSIELFSQEHTDLNRFAVEMHACFTTVCRVAIISTVLLKLQLIVLISKEYLLCFVNACI